MTFDFLHLFDFYCVCACVRVWVEKIQIDLEFFVLCSCFGREKAKRFERFLSALSQSDCWRRSNTRPVTTSLVKAAL